MDPWEGLFFSFGSSPLRFLESIYILFLLLFRNRNQPYSSLPYPTESYLTLLYSILPYPVLPCLALPSPALPYPTQHTPTHPYLTLPLSSLTLPLLNLTSPTCGRHAHPFPNLLLFHHKVKADSHYTPEPSVTLIGRSCTPFTLTLTLISHPETL